MCAVRLHERHESCYKRGFELFDIYCCECDSMLGFNLVLFIYLFHLTQPGSNTVHILDITNGQ